MRTYFEALQAIRKTLSSSTDLVQRAGIGGINSEAEQILLASCRKVGIHITRLELYSKIQEPFPSPEKYQGAWNLLERWSEARAQGQPLQYLTGFQTFLDHDYQVGPGVLIPRPESEILIEQAKMHLNPIPGGPRLGLEVGLGSGVLSIELLGAFPQLKMAATELSADALQYAQKNFGEIVGESLETSSRFHLLRVTDPLLVLEPFSQVVSQNEADFLITNPPYLMNESELEEGVLRYEPHLALMAPPQDPLYFYRKTAEDAGRYLKPQGWVFAEIPHERSQEILSLFVAPHWEAKLFKDLNSRERVLVARSIRGESNG